MVSPAATDLAFYDDTLAWATQTGDTDLVSTLQRSRPPPYDEVCAYEPAEQWIELPQAGHRPHFEQPAAFEEIMRTVLTDTR